MKRQDVHAPSSPNFDPEAYDCWGVFDTGPDSEDNAARVKAVKSLREKGFRIGSGGASKCGHCGQGIRYAALLVRQDVQEFIFVGQDCLINRFEDLTKAEFDALRKSAKLNRERATKKEVFEQTLSENPWLAEVTTYGGDFLDSLYEQAKNGKQLSERQIEAGVKALAKAKEYQAEFEVREAQKRVLLASGVQAPEGKTKVVGKVVKIKWQETVYGDSLKAIVESDEGWKVWVTVPSSLQDKTVLVEDEWVFTQGAKEGDVIEFTATFQRSDRDPLFAFGKRPTKAKILSVA